MAYHGSASRASMLVCGLLSEETICTGKMSVSSSGLELSGTADEAACAYVRNYVASDTGEVSGEAQKYIKGWVHTSSLITDRLGIIVVIRRVTLYLMSERYRLANSHVVKPNGGGHRRCPFSVSSQVKHIYSAWN